MGFSGEKRNNSFFLSTKNLTKSRKFREVCFCWMDKGKGVWRERPLQKSVSYETTPTKVPRSNTITIKIIKLGVAGKAYAF